MHFSLVLLDYSNIYKSHIFWGVHLLKGGLFEVGDY